MKNNMTDFIEIPFGARDSELHRFEYTIPKGYTAEIVDGKVIVKKKESEGEKIRKNCIHFLELQKAHHADTSEIDDCIAYLEKQKEQKIVQSDNKRDKSSQLAVAHAVEQTKSLLEKWEKQKEQEPAECIVPPPSDPFVFNLHSIIYNFGKQIAAECLDTHILDTELDEYVTNEKVDKCIKENISYLVKYHPLRKREIQIANGFFAV